MSVPQTRPYYTDEEIEASEAWQRETADAMMAAIKDAIACAKALHPADVSYAYDTVQHYVAVDEAAWRAETGTPAAYEIKRRKEISNGKRTRVFQRDAYRCLHCGGYDRLTVDHIIPVSKGGTNDEANLQTLCKSCNSKKGARV